MAAWPALAGAQVTAPVAEAPPVSPLPADFDAALPPLDQIAPAPLTAGVPTPAGPTMRVDPAATADSAAVPVAGPVETVVPEADLVQPLRPLATFDATPEAQTPVQAAQGDVPKALPYRVEVSGLKPVGLEDDFRSFSALLHDGKKAANGAQIGVRADEDVALAERILKADGYYDGIATATVPPTPGTDGVVPVTIAATPGERYRFGAIAITGLPDGPYKIARDALLLKTGDPIVAAAVEDGEARIALRLPENGYPFVKVGQRDILLDEATHRGEYTLPVDGGPRSTFGALRTAGDPVFGLDHLAIFPRFKAGQLYDSRQVDDLRQALVGTSLLSTVSVEPVRTGTVAADGSEAVDLLVRQTRGPARTLSASGGYGTGEGIKLTGEWQHRNLFPPEGALIVDVTAGTLQQSVGAIFRRSNAGQRDRTFQAGASIARQRFDAYNAQTANLSASLSRQSTPIWQKRWTWSVGGELIATRETPFVAAMGDRQASTYFIAALPLQLGYDRSNSLLDPTKGFRLNGRLSPEAQKQSGGGFDGYARMLAEASAYYPITKSIVLAGRARLGSIAGAARDDIAPSRRLYSGGGGSVRGFGYQQLGPKDADNNPVGGRSQTEFAFEARYRFGNYGIVPFMDAGRVGEGAAPSLSGMRYGAGIGARYYTNFGPMRIDVATPLGRKPGESKVALYISIGQAF